MDGFETALAFLPERVRAAAQQLDKADRSRASEFRLRCGRPATVLVSNSERVLCRGEVSSSELGRVLELCSRASPYAVEESLRCGYITAGYGVRVGFCGEAVSSAEGVRTVKGISSAAVRIPREIRGCADGLCHLPFLSALIISPPGGGKTTLLRDMIRQYSEQGVRVALADERGEVSALAHGRCGFDLGRCTDVLSGGRKCETAMMLLRSMSPEMLAMDEITAQADIEACETVCHCGVGLLATAHAGSVEELRDRPLYRTLLERRIFRKAIVISRRGSGRVYREVTLC